VVIDEEDHQPLLIHRISHEDIYQRQGGAWQPARHAAFISRGAAVSQSVRERGRQREREREGERGKRADSVL
jgi:hypothetical protein